jgi:nicotine blue oxidoreductase
MGTPKALLELRGETFLSRAVAALRAGGCEPVIVVVGPREDPDASAIAHLAASLGAGIAINPIPGSEQIDSLRHGLSGITGVPEAVVVTPVDAPDTPGDVVEQLITAVRDGGAIALPVYNGRRGHPLVIRGELIGEVMENELPEGMRTLLRRHTDRIVEVTTDTSGVLLDVDTPEDYRKLITGQP